MLKDYFDLQCPLSRKQAVYWHTAGGYVSNGIIMVQGLVLIPIYIKILGAPLYGYWLASGGILAWLTMVDIGGAAITRQRCAHAYGKGNLQKMVDYFWHGTVIMCGVIAVLGLLIILFVPSIPDLIHVESGHREIILNCLYLSGIGAALHIAELYLREFINAIQRTMLTAVAGIIGLLSALIFILTGLLFMNWGLYALAAAMVIRSAIPLMANLIITLCLLRSTRISVVWSRIIFKDYLLTTPSVLAAKASSVFTTQLPVVLLTRWTGPELTVAYTVSMRMIEMAKHFVNKPLSGLYTSCAHLFGDETSSDSHKMILFKKVTFAFIFVTSGAFGAYVLLNKGFIELWVSSDKFLGSGFSILAGIATLLQLRSMLYSSLIGADGGIQSAGYSLTAEKLVTSALMVVLTYHYHAIGVLVALCAGPVLFQTLYHFLLKRRLSVVAQALFPLQWIWVAIGAFFWVLSKFDHLWLVNTWLDFGLRFLVLLPFPLLAVLIGIPSIRNKCFRWLRLVNNLVGTQQTM